MKTYVVCLNIYHNGEHSKVSKYVTDASGYDTVVSSMQSIAKSLMSYVNSQPAINIVDDLGRIICIRDTKTASFILTFSEYVEDYTRILPATMLSDIYTPDSKGIRIFSSLFFLEDK